jgi:hypothetical protein
MEASSPPWSHLTPYYNVFPYQQTRLETGINSNVIRHVLIHLGDNWCSEAALQATGPDANNLFIQWIRGTILTTNQDG